MRSAMLETIRQDYIRTARAKGLENRSVIYKHALRNSLIPIITLLASVFPAMVGGSFIIEQIFSIPGIGQLGIQGIFDRDYPLIMALLVLSSVLTIVGVLVADILYAAVDPRIAYTKKQ
jgi:peptide/nickel transport system permease protein